MDEDFGNADMSSVGLARPAANIMDTMEGGDTATAEGGGEPTEDRGDHEINPGVVDDDKGDVSMEGASAGARGADRNKKGWGPGKRHGEVVQPGYGAKAPAAKHRRMEQKSPSDASDEGESSTIRKTVKKRRPKLGKPRVGRAGYAAKAATELGVDVAKPEA